MAIKYNEKYSKFILNEDNIKKLKELYIRDKKETIAAALIYAVDSSTIRAFEGNKKHKPLSIYRAWAKKKFIDDISVFDEIVSKGFELSYRNLYDSLNSFWTKEGKEEPLYPYKIFKLLDLTFKQLSKCDEVPEIAREVMLKEAYCPLDKYSLTLYNSEFKDNNGFVGFKNPSMGNIRDKDHHRQIQNEIGAVLNGTNHLLFDTYAWNYYKANKVIDDSLFKLKEIDKK